jgi:hypothetical protein
MAKSRKSSVNRRGFLKGAAVGAAASATALVSGLPDVEAAQAPASAALQVNADRQPELRLQHRNSLRVTPEMSARRPRFAPSIVLART